MIYTMTSRKFTIILDTVSGKISGDTYQMRDMIKEDFPGAKWNKDEKCWEYSDIEGRINEYRDYFSRCYKLAAEAADIFEADAWYDPDAAAWIVPVNLEDDDLSPRCGEYRFQVSKDSAAYELYRR